MHHEEESEYDSFTPFGKHRGYKSRCPGIDDTRRMREFRTRKKLERLTEMSATRTV